MAGHAFLSISGGSPKSQLRCWTADSRSSRTFRFELLLQANCKAWRIYPAAFFQSLPFGTRRRLTSQVCISASKPGFGDKPKKRAKKAEPTPQVKDRISCAKQILGRKHQNLTGDAGIVGSEAAPSLAVNEVVQTYEALDEELFESRLAEIKRVADEQKVLTEQKRSGPIDYNAPISSSGDGLSGNLGAKIGIGALVVVFGLIFALGDFLPTGSNSVEKSSVAGKELTKEELDKLKAQVTEFENILKDSSEDRSALEGAAVSYAELGELDKAAGYLSRIVQMSQGDAEVLRLLAEIQNAKGDYDASISSYRAAIRASGKRESLTLLRGLTDTLLSSKKPSQAVGELLAAKARLKYNLEQVKTSAQESLLLSATADGSGSWDLPEDANTAVDADPVTVDLLLGKAYAAWEGHTSDAVSVYDQLIASYPEDYRGYLAKGVLLKEQNKRADAERMFIQARYLAPSNSRAIVDTYLGR